jgi:hypothetical protein
VLGARAVFSAAASLDDPSSRNRLTLHGRFRQKLQLVRPLQRAWHTEVLEALRPLPRSIAEQLEHQRR